MVIKFDIISTVDETYYINGGITMSYEGVYEFYRDRINACPLYGFEAGEQILTVIHSCAYYDAGRGFLTSEEYSSIIKLCQQAHIKMMEDNYNEGWK